MPGELAGLLDAEPQAPRYHLVAPEGHCLPFDPNGCLYHRGRFHVFYIFQDPDRTHGRHCWGHASSPDLVDWTFHPTALAAGPEDPENGIFSGCALLARDGTPTLVYYGIDAGICVATARDPDLLEWDKHPANPVIPEPKRGDPAFDVYRVFDPHVWLEGDRYHAILGGRVKPHEIRDTAYLFSSEDLVTWRYERPFYQPHPDWTDAHEDCACPDFFALGDKHVLMCISHARGARYYVGRWSLGTFVPQNHERLAWPGGSCFATESCVDGMGRRVAFAWVPGQRRRPDGFSVMTLPRVLSLAEGNRLKIEPAREIELLRGRHVRIDPFRLDDERHTRLELAGASKEIELRLQPESARRVGLNVRCAPNDVEQTRIVYDAGAGTLSIDTTRSSLDPDVYRRSPIVGATPSPRDVPVQTAPLELYPEDPLHLRIFIDRSIIEIYANDHLCMTQRIYPTLAGSLYVRLFSEGGTAKVEHLEAWDIDPFDVRPPH